MQVAFHIPRGLQLHHMSHPARIQTPSSNIRCHKDIYFPGREQCGMCGTHLPRQAFVEGGYFELRDGILQGCTSCLCCFIAVDKHQCLQHWHLPRCHSHVVCLRSCLPHPRHGPRHHTCTHVLPQHCSSFRPPHLHSLQQRGMLRRLNYIVQRFSGLQAPRQGLHIHRDGVQVDPWRQQVHTWSCHMGCAGKASGQPRSWALSGPRA